MAESAAAEAVTTFGPGTLPATIYDPDFDRNALPPDVRTAASRHTFNGKLPVWMAIVFTLLTGGLFAYLFFPLKHRQLPKLLPDDPGGAKAFGFLFIPIFNIYWFFFMWSRLARRLNFQLRLRNRPAIVKPRLVTVGPIAVLGAGMLFRGSLVGTFCFLMNGLVLTPLIAIQIESAVSAIFKADHRVARFDDGAAERTSAGDTSTSLSIAIRPPSGDQN